MKEYIYYWYHHMISPAHIKAVHRSIEDKNFEMFIEHYKELNSLGLKQGYFDKEFNSFIPIIYLPDTISVYNTETEDFEESLDILNKDNFMKITIDECECG